MKLVLDPEWEVCYIEITRAEQRLLDWPPRLSPVELSRDVRLLMHGVPPASLSWGTPPDGYKELVDKVHVIHEIAWPYFSRFNHNRRAAWPPDTCFLLGIEARVVV